MAKRRATKQKQVTKKTASKPAAKKPVAKKPVAKKPVAKKPKTKQPAAKKRPAKKGTAGNEVKANWWVHKFIAGGVTSFLINHNNAMTGEVQKLPDNLVGVATIEQAEQLWGTMTAVDNSNWYAHRIGSGLARTFSVDHSPTAANSTLNCGPYSSINYMVTNCVISKMFKLGVCVVPGK